MGMLRYLARPGAELQAYFAYRHDTRTDFTLTYVIAGLIFVLGEPFVIRGSGFVAPGISAELAGLGYGVRLLIFGLPPALAFLLGIWWLDWRSIRRNPGEYARLKKYQPDSSRDSRP